MVHYKFAEKYADGAVGTGDPGVPAPACHKDPRGRYTKCTTVPVPPPKCGPFTRLRCPP